MRDYAIELKNRVEFIKRMLKESGATGIIFGNSGGKDSALVGILCKKACDNTVGVMLPCQSKRNFGEDMEDAGDVAEKFSIKTRIVNLSEVKEIIVEKLEKHTQLSDAALANIAPRIRMIALYAIAASENRLVAGTGNRSEQYMGYFTKWGDGACDFNPIADLTVKETYEFLRYLEAPENIITKAPSGGLYEGQTDEQEMGISYEKIDEYILNGKAKESDIEIIEGYHKRSEHKRRMPRIYGEE